MDFNEKKEQFACAIEEYIANNELKSQFIEYLKILNQDEEFTNKELFKGILKEMINNLDELSRRELKQRILMIRSFD